MVEHDLYALMRSYIPEELHSDFQLTIRDGLRLRHADADDKVIGYFGGLPELPEGVDWPGDGHHQFEHVATIDLAELPAVDLNLPDSGRNQRFGLRGCVPGGLSDPGRRQDSNSGWLRSQGAGQVVALSGTGHRDQDAVTVGVAMSWSADGSTAGTTDVRTGSPDLLRT